jgi:AcrR family transcriptional regulator
VHLDELEQASTILVGQPVGGLDLPSLLDVLEELLGSSVHRRCCLSYLPIVSIEYMATRREELVATAARMFAANGFHGTSMGALADEMGIRKASLYSLIESKQQLLYEATRAGADAFHAALDAVPEELPAVERVRLALRAHLGVVADQLEVATVFTREWRYLEPAEREEFVAERRRYQERWQSIFRDGVEHGELRSDLDVATATLLVLSAANWAYTWLRHGVDTDDLADRFVAILVDGMRGYATPE